MSTVSLDTIVDFLRSGGGHVTYTELKHKFSQYLNDPVNADFNRQNFRDLVKKVASFTQQADGERVLTLKDKWRLTSGENSNNNSIAQPQSQIKSNASGLTVTLTPLSTSKDSGYSQSSSLNYPKSAPRAESSLSSSSDIPSFHHRQWLIACCNGDIAAMKTLLDEKPELLDDADSSLGYTAFHWAAAAGNCDAIEFLTSRAKSSDVINKVTRAGHTPLHIAYMHNRLTAASLLEKRGADSLAEDFDCRQPSQYARLNGLKLRNRGQGQLDTSVNCYSGQREGSSLAGKIASKVRDKVRSLSASSNSSAESVHTSSSANSALRRTANHNGTNDNKSKSNSARSSFRKMPFLRGLSSSFGALNIGDTGRQAQTSPIGLGSHFTISRSQEITPLKERASGRKSSELMPPPPKPAAISRV